MKFEIDLRIPMMYLHIQFQPYTYIHTNKSYRVETENLFKRDNSVKKSSDQNQIHLYLRNLMMYPYIKFELKVCNPYKDNEQKLKISIFFSSSRRITLSKNQQTITKFEHDLHIPMTNLHMQFES